jgi:hypothetical protein
MPLARLAAAFATAALLAGCASTENVAPYVGTWKATQGDAVLHLRVAADGRVDFFDPADGRRTSGQAAFGTVGGRAGFSGLLPGAEVFAIGGSGNALQLSVGSRLYALRPLPAAQYGVPAPGAVQAGGAPGGGPATAGAAGSLAGLRLSMAKGGNGYFTERSYDFCANGRVFTRWAESSLSQLGSGVGERTDQGSWRQSGQRLELSLARGGAQSFQVQRPEPRVVRLDATAYAAEPSARCR